MTAALEAKHLTKSFGGVRAVDDVSFEVHPGEVVAVIGPNGAGKSTVFDCVAGRQRQDGGSVVLGGTVLKPGGTAQRARLGLERTFQRVEVFPSLTVHDHLLVALRATHPSPRLWRDLLRLSKQTPDERARIASTLAFCGLSELSGRQVGSLGLGLCRLVELARALVADPLVLLLDEASSGLDDDEVEMVVQRLRERAATAQTAIVVIEHDLAMVERVADRVLVMVSGSLVAEGSYAEVMATPVVQAAYLGSAP